jgi:hypothetical protein
MDHSGTLASSLSRFVSWLDSYGELSQDHYDFWASPIGGKAKALYYEHRWGVIAVAPFVLLDSFFPASRALFWGKTRFPIADAHYAMGFFNLHRATGDASYLERGRAFLAALDRTRCPGWERYCWGYPFNWVNIGHTVTTEQTPLGTTTPYAYEAFLEGYALDGDERKRDIARSIAEFTLRDLHDNPLPSRGAAGSYTPLPKDDSHVVNASAYRAFLLTDAGKRFSRQEYLDTARRNADFVLASQNVDGSWCYSGDGKENFVDNFHTCFVLKNLIKAEKHDPRPEYARAIERGFAFYQERLLDADMLPVPFAVKPRMTLHSRELYDYAECLNLCLLLRGRQPRCQVILDALVADLAARWQKRDGSFRTRQMALGWNNVPYHRWAQSQLFRSLTLLFLEEQGASPRGAAGGG